MIEMFLLRKYTNNQTLQKMKKKQLMNDTSTK